jgi:hypothetical protein
MKNPVGPVLRMGDEVEQIIAAIEDDNPGTDIEVIDRGAYVRVQGEDEITVTQETLLTSPTAAASTCAPSVSRSSRPSRPHAPSLT